MVEKAASGSSAWRIFRSKSWASSLHAYLWPITLPASNRSSTQAHLGAPKAITATAHKIACVVYHMLKYQEEFLPLDVALYELKSQERRMRNLRKQAEELGYELTERKQAA